MMNMKTTKKNKRIYRIDFCLLYSYIEILWGYQWRETILSILFISTYNKIKVLGDRFFFGGIFL